MIDGQNILQLAIPLNTSRTDKDCTVLLQRYGSFCWYGTIFSLMQAQIKRKEKPFRLNQFLSKAGVQFKTSSMQAVLSNCKWRFYIFRKFKKSAKFHGLNRSSK